MFGRPPPPAGLALGTVAAVEHVPAPVGDHAAGGPHRQAGLRRARPHAAHVGPGGATSLSANAFAAGENVAAAVGNLATARSQRQARRGETCTYGRRGIDRAVVESGTAAAVQHVVAAVGKEATLGRNRQARRRQASAHAATVRSPGTAGLPVGAGAALDGTAAAVRCSSAFGAQLIAGLGQTAGLLVHRCVGRLRWLVFPSRLAAAGHPGKRDRSEQQLGHCVHYGREDSMGEARASKGPRIG